MRISTDEEDSGYKPDYWRYRVHLDGQELRRCITADTQRGEVLVYDKRDYGKKNPRTKLLKGKVQIFSMPGWVNLEDE